MPRADAVVWDMDGTLFDSVDCVTGAYADAAEAAGLPRPDPETVVSGYALGSPAVLLGWLLGRDCTPADLDGYHAALRRRAATVTPHDGIAAALAEIRLPMAVFTGASTRAAELLLDATGLRESFAFVIGADRVSRPKPDAEGLLRACVAIGVAAARTAYVGDSPLDLECARRAGSTAIAACWGHQHDPEAPRDVSAAHPSDVVSWVLG